MSEIKEKMKIKDLPKDFNMVGCKLKGLFIVSGWNKGFWVEEKQENSNIMPIFFKSFEEIKNWEVEIPLHKIGIFLN